MNRNEKRLYFNFLKILPLLFLAVLFSLQARTFSRKTAVKEALTAILNDKRGYVYLAAKDSATKNKYNAFAKEISEIIPDGSRVAFVHNRSEEEHYRIRYLMKPKIFAFYFVIPEISKEAVIKKMESSKSKYLIMADDIQQIKTIYPQAKTKTAVFKLDEGTLEKIYPND